MRRAERDTSWQVLAFAVVVVGLSILAPLAWYAEHSHSSHKRSLARRHRASGRDARVAVHELPPPRPQLAPIGPLVADQISLDPSIQETPAIPTGRPDLSDLLPGESEEENELRLSAISRPVQPIIPPTSEMRAARESSELPGTSPFAIPEQSLPEQSLPTRAWPEAKALLEQVHGAAQAMPAAASWGERVTSSLSHLAGLPSLADPAVSAELSNLRSLADEAKVLAQSATDDQSRSKILRAGYAIVRRLVIWDMVYGLASSGNLSAAPIVDHHAWSAALHEVDSMLQATGAAANWRKYLLIDRALTDFDSHNCTPADQRQLARDMLYRLHSTQLSREQEKFLNSPAFEALDEQLEARAAQTPDLTALISAIERHESEHSVPAARNLAMEFDIIRWSTDAEVRELAEAVNAYYRNANVRVALSIALVNRMIPPQNPQVEAVEDNIVGAWVSGQSQTSTNVRVTLVPDKQKWNLSLEADGQVATDTSSSKGPATFFQHGWSFFKARKKITMDCRGIRAYSAEADANANSDLQDFATEFDGVPLLGGLVRNIARNQYEAAQPQAKMETEGRIIQRASSQLDSQVTERLEKSKQDFQLKILKPVRDLNLEPTPVDLETTADRLIARYRIAAREELGAYTPRPQAPSDSMLSVQLHESAMNNVLEQLHLGGRKIELAELYKEMAERFAPGKKVEVPEDLPENVFVTFAEDDPIRVDCQDGRVRLTIHITELVQQGTRNRWTNFSVHAYYAPSADQLDANLYRDGIIELIGDNRPLPLGQRTGLTAIFARVLSRNRKLHIINQQLAAAPQLRDQQVTQFVIHDGWVGVALGPKAPDRQAIMHPRPALTRE
jgi:hypothetical protein